ncbi:hypothetical protein JKP76_11765 [Blastococcus sp. TML/C7B]|uniref:LysR substrate-binding domain-containing protein n=1 Tax=Blastococcus sp. TML/C7B TaxID=2798728 RepID=UPI00190C49B7|nr:hypothetical protein [Blastococcus sp. TML/C7B]
MACSRPPAASSCRRWPGCSPSTPGSGSRSPSWRWSRRCRSCAWAGSTSSSATSTTATPRPRPAGLAFTPLLEEPLLLVLPAGHPFAAPGGAVPLAALRDEVWASSAAGTGHHASVVGTCRELGGYEPDLRHRSNDADVQLELVRTAGAVALMPALTLPAADPGLAVSSVAEGVVRRRLVVATREGRPGPALRTVLATVDRQGRSLAGAAPAAPSSGSSGAPGPR